MSNNLGIIAIAIKLGPKLLSLMTKVAKSGKFLKVGMAGSSVAAYSYLFTWEFALTICIAVFIHEMGHLRAMKSWGMKTSGIYLIPFFGGAAVANESFPSREAEAHIGIMGPVWGLGTMLGAMGIYYAFDEPMWAAIAGWIGLLNLINLLPVNPLDGGRIVKSITCSIHKGFGFTIMMTISIVMIYIFFYIGLELFAIIGIIGMFELISDYLNHRRQRDIILASGEIKSKINEFACNRNLSTTENELLDTIDGVSSNPHILKMMKASTIMYYSFCYVALILTLFTLMMYISHVPGADIAMEMLQG
jgi:Zn-dependent protease